MGSIHAVRNIHKQQNSTANNSQALQLRFSEKISFCFCVHGTATLEKGCSNHTVNGKSSCQLLPRLSKWRTGTHHLRYKQNSRCSNTWPFTTCPTHARNQAKQGVCATTRERFNDLNWNFRRTPALMDSTSVVKAARIKNDNDLQDPPTN